MMHHILFLPFWTYFVKPVYPSPYAPSIRNVRSEFEFELKLRFYGTSRKCRKSVKHVGYPTFTGPDCVVW